MLVMAVALPLVIAFTVWVIAPIIGYFWNEILWVAGALICGASYFVIHFFQKAVFKAARLAYRYWRRRWKAFKAYELNQKYGGWGGLLHHCLDEFREARHRGLSIWGILVLIYIVFTTVAMLTVPIWSSLGNLFPHSQNPFWSKFPRLT